MAKDGNFLKTDARSRIRTGELLRDRVLSPAPLTKLGNPRTIVLMLFTGFKRTFTTFPESRSFDLTRIPTP